MLKLFSAALLASLFSFTAFAGSPEQDSQVRSLRDQFAQGHPVQLDGFARAQDWNCKHYNALTNDTWVEQHVTMDFRSFGPYVMNSGNFVVKSLKNTSQGLVGHVSIPEYNDANLYAVLRTAADGRSLIAEVSVDPATLQILGSHYHHGSAFQAPASLVDSSKAVFYYSSCQKAQ